VQPGQTDRRGNWLGVVRVALLVAGVCVGASWIPVRGRDGSNDMGGVRLTWVYPTEQVSDGEVAESYRRLGTANGWTMYDFTPGVTGLGGRKDIDGTCVWFELRLPSSAADGQRTFSLSLLYHGLGDGCAI
jgi:hypothetical protein